MVLSLPTVSSLPTGSEPSSLPTGCDSLQSCGDSKTSEPRGTSKRSCPCFVRCSPAALPIKFRVGLLTLLRFSLPHRNCHSEKRSDEESAFAFDVRVPHPPAAASAFTARAAKTLERVFKGAGVAFDFSSGAPCSSRIPGERGAFAFAFSLSPFSPSLTSITTRSTIRSS